MIFTNSHGAGQHGLDEDGVAELTMAAYLVALRHSAASRWLDLQLELWRALSATAAWREPNEAAGRAEDWLAELADVAYRIALPYGRRQSFLDLELELYQTLRCTALRHAWARRNDGSEAET